MKNISLPYKIIIAAALVLLVLALSKPKIALRMYRAMIGEYEANDKKLIKEIDSLNSVRKRDSIRYTEALKIKEIEYDYEKDRANEKYNKLNTRFRQNEKELDNYRNSSFDDKFELFSNAVIGKDPSQR